MQVAYGRLRRLPGTVLSEIYNWSFCHVRQWNLNERRAVIWRLPYRLPCYMVQIMTCVCFARCIQVQYKYMYYTDTEIAFWQTDGTLQKTVRHASSLSPVRPWPVVSCQILSSSSLTGFFVSLLIWNVVWHLPFE